jgi:hypothetical protein
MGSLPIYEETPHIWEDHNWEDLPYMGSLQIYGETPHILGDSPYMVNFHIGVYPDIWVYPEVGVFPDIGVYPYKVGGQGIPEPYN